MHPESPAIRRSYAQFLLEVNSEEDTAEIQIQEADMLEERSTAMRRLGGFEAQYGSGGLMHTPDSNSEISKDTQVLRAPSQDGPDLVLQGVERPAATEHAQRLVERQASGPEIRRKSI